MLSISSRFAPETPILLRLLQVSGVYDEYASRDQVDGDRSAG